MEMERAECDGVMEAVRPFYIQSPMSSILNDDDRQTVIPGPLVRLLRVYKLST